MFSSMPPCLKSLRKRHNHFVLYASFFRRLSKFSHHCVPPTTPAAGVCFDFPSHFVLFVLILKKGNFHPTSRTVICITHHPHNHPEVFTIAALCACWHFYCFFLQHGPIALRSEHPTLPIPKDNTRKPSGLLHPFSALEP